MASANNVSTKLCKTHAKHDPSNSIDNNTVSTWIQIKTTTQCIKAGALCWIDISRSNRLKITGNNDSCVNLTKLPSITVLESTRIKYTNFSWIKLNLATNCKLTHSGWFARSTTINGTKSWWIKYSDSK